MSEEIQKPLVRVSDNGIYLLNRNFMPTHRHNHKNTTYELLLVTNISATREDWVEMAVYRDIENRVWSRPYFEFMAKCAPIYLDRRGV